jgi:hypothetical protein
MFAHSSAASFLQLPAWRRSDGTNSLVPPLVLGTKTAQEDVNTWAPSGSDSLAEDWAILE